MADFGDKLDAWFTKAYAYRWASPIPVIVAAVILGVVADVGSAVLVLAGGALLLVIAMLWASVQALTGDTELSLEDAISLAVPTAAEEQKRAVLRALKDLEYERSVGKISDEDYTQLKARYRAEAKSLLKELDSSQTESRARAEALLAEALGKQTTKPKKKKKRDKKKRESEGWTAPGAEPETESDTKPNAEDTEVRHAAKPQRPDRAKRQKGEQTASEPEPEPDLGSETNAEDTKVKPAAQRQRPDAAKPLRGEQTAAKSQRDDAAKRQRVEQTAQTAPDSEPDSRTTCAECDSPNDSDAVFCKRCGAKLSEESS